MKNFTLGFLLSSTLFLLIISFLPLFLLSDNKLYLKNNSNSSIIEIPAPEIAWPTGPQIEVMPKFKENLKAPVPPGDF